MRIYFFFIVTIFLSGKLLAQDLPLNNHSFLNPYTYNPGFAGYENRPAVFFGYRNQWTGIEGAPQTVYLNFHSVAADVIPYGVNIYSDKRSVLTTTYTLLTAGFRARIEEDNHYLSFALSGGMGFNSIDFSALSSSALNDPVIASALENNSFLEGNAGLVYHNNGFNLGVSLPKIFNNKPVDSLGFNIGDFSPISNGILMAGYKWNVNPESFAIEPWVLYYYFDGRDGQFEANTTFHIKDVIWIGGSYRMNYGASAYLGINIKENFKLGYTYEFGVSAVDNFKNNNTHEVTLGIIFGKSEKDKKTNFYARRRRMLTTMRSRNEEQKEEEQSQSLYRVENDPFEEEEKPEPEEKQPEPKPEPQPEPEQEDDDLVDEDGEIDLDEFLEGFEEEPAEEDTVQEEPPRRAPEPTPQPEEEEEESFEALESFDAPEVDEVTTRDEEGIYIGPKTVTKGDHLLELEQGYYVVVGTFNSYRDAEEYSDKLFIQSFYTKFGYISQTTDYYVYIFHSSDNKQECVDTMERLKQLADFREMWVLTVQ